MKPLPDTPILLQLARRVVWFKEPREALKDTLHFLAHVMTFGTVEDVVAVRDTVGMDGFVKHLSMLHRESSSLARGPAGTSSVA